ncbi:MAG: prolipoprotein diacylglyceryl transferase [Propionibacteriaceae bacterium]|jgi:prolipoprotein diacylglyceryl transferase|nr:prolipoprotein diacylglyceryl transferase [Propionibacteriaceae bacterium]
MPLFLPSPAHGVFYLGPLPIRAYALSIICGIIVAIFLARRRWRSWGGNVDQLENLLIISVLVGIVGARVYWVVIEWHRYFGAGHSEPWYHIFYIWEGGLGIWGGIAFGFITGGLLCRRYHINFWRLADCVAPAFLLAQAIGRMGNWWNQELYGYPSTLPWALEIDQAHRLPGYAQFATYHPTFLYEMIWDLMGVGLLLFVERRCKFGRGKLFALYIVTYATGRFLVELLRIDPVSVYGGLRVNSWATLLGMLVGLCLLIWRIRFRPGANLIQPAAVAAPAGTASEESPSGCQSRGNDGVGPVPTDEGQLDRLDDDADQSLVDDDRSASTKD